MAQKLNRTNISKRALRIIEPALDDIVHQCASDPTDLLLMQAELIRAINRAAQRAEARATAAYLATTLQTYAEEYQDRPDVAHELYQISAALRASIHPRYSRRTQDI